jgi:GT2 family glycosyltransferase
MVVSFVIPLYNCLPLTQAMLASLRTSLPAGLEHEIIFVDDGSTDGTRDWLQSLRRSNSLGSSVHVVLNERNLGYAGANNRGGAVARGEFLGLLNNDLILAPGWLEPMLALQQRLGLRAGLVGNVQRNARTGAIDHAGIFINHRGKPEHNPALPLGLRFRSGHTWRRVAAVTGACALVRRELFTRLGGFDEGFANGGEDVDFCLRSHAAGCLSAVALRSVVRHHISASPGRKLRDEQNSRRLTLRWRDELVRLAAADSFWSQRYLESQWTSPRDPADYALGLKALGHCLHLRRDSPAAYAGMQAAITEELARWDRILGP